MGKRGRTAVCGTYAGYYSHLHFGTDVCTPCRAALNAYHRKWQSAHPEQRAERSACWSAALITLKYRHREQYKELRQDRTNYAAMAALKQLHVPEFQAIYQEQRAYRRRQKERRLGVADIATATRSRDVSCQPLAPSLDTGGTIA
jgi:hypothetical protein